MKDYERIALFDFCETIVNFPSADAYVRYVKGRVRGRIGASFLEAARKILVRTKFMKVLQKFSREGSINKRMLLRQIKGVSQEEMEHLGESYYREKIRPNYIPEVVREIQRCKGQGYALFIVSGGYDIYLKHVAREFGFSGMLCTNLEFREGKFTGRYRGLDCIGDGKVTLLRQYFKRDNLWDCDSIAFSDAASDVPFLSYCRRGAVVCRDVPRWAKDRGFEVLKWARQGKR